MPSDDITPLRDLFVYHIFGIPAQARRWVKDPSSYRLAVTGLVKNELSLSLADLRREFEVVRFATVLQCMTNVHWGKIELTGAPLTQILDAAGLLPSATKLALRSADGFTSDLKLAYVRSSSEPVLAIYEINGEELPLDHGCPARIASPGKYGYKWPKWIQEIEAVDYDFKGHYEGKRRWSDDGDRGTRVT